MPDLKPLIPGLLAKEIEKANAAAAALAAKQPGEPTTSNTSITAVSEITAENATENVNIDDEMAKIELEIHELEHQSAINDLNPIGDEPDMLVSVDEKELDTLTSLSLVDEQFKDVKLAATVADPQIAVATSKESNSLANANLKILMDSFIAQLPNCVNRELIDKAAKEFCTNLNTKMNRKRLVGALFQVRVSIL